MISRLRSVDDVERSNLVTALRFRSANYSEKEDRASKQRRRQEEQNGIDCVPPDLLCGSRNHPRKRLSHRGSEKNTHVERRHPATCELGRIGTPHLRIHENKESGDQTQENAKGHIEPQRIAV